MAFLMVKALGKWLPDGGPRQCLARLSNPGKPGLEGGPAAPPLLRHACLPASHARAAANQRRARARGGASMGATAHARCPGRAPSPPRGRVEGGGGGSGSGGWRGPVSATAGRGERGAFSAPVTHPSSPRSVSEWTLPGLALSRGGGGAVRRHRATS